MEKEKDLAATNKDWRKLDVPVRRPDPLHNIFAWSVGVGMALLFLLFVLYAYLVHHR